MSCLVVGDMILWKEKIKETGKILHVLPIEEAFREPDAAFNVL